MERINARKGLGREGIGRVVGVLAGAGVVVLPTDTVYGLHCRADDEVAIKRIIGIKKRADNMGFVLLMNGYPMLRKYTFVSKAQENYLRSIWPFAGRKMLESACRSGQRPTSVLLASRPLMPAISRGGRDSAAVRIPRNDLLLAIIGRLKVPLVSTSLNLSGQDLVQPGMIEKVFDIWPDLAVDIGPVHKKRSSRLLDLRDIAKIKIIRK